MTVVYKTSWAVVNLRNWFFCSWIVVEWNWTCDYIHAPLTPTNLSHIYVSSTFLFFLVLSLSVYPHGTLSLTYWGWLSSSHGDYNIGHSALYKLLMLSQVIGMKCGSPLSSRYNWDTATHVRCNSKNFSLRFDILMLC